MSGLKYSMQYKDTPVVKHSMGKRTWRIFDQPGKNRMMITSSVGAALRDGAGHGVTLSLYNPNPKEDEVREAALDFLNHTERLDYEITRCFLIAEPQWEIQYAKK